MCLLVVQAGPKALPPVHSAGGAPPAVLLRTVDVGSGLRAPGSGTDECFPSSRLWTLDSGRSVLPRAQGVKPRADVLGSADDVYSHRPRGAPHGLDGGPQVLR